MAVHPATSFPSDTAPDTGFFGHPRGLSTLFFTELWERFSFYGMRALLILYMTAGPAQSGLGFPVPKAAAIYGMYTAMVYLLSLPGGWIADKILGQRKAVLYGGAVIALGHFSLTIPLIEAFYLGLVLIVLGTGLLKPCVSTMVGELYRPDDHRRDAGFSIFYMGINIGALVAPLLCGYLGEKVNWHYGFGLAGVGMTVGLIQYVLGARNLGSIGMHPVAAENPESARLLKRNLRTGIFTIAVIVCAAVLLSLTHVIRIDAQMITGAGGFLLVLTTIAFFIWLFTANTWSPVEKKRLLAVLVLFIAAAAFWANYEQAGSTLNLFAERNTRLTLLGFSYPASWFQSMNSLFIMPLAPILAWLWVKLGPKEPSSPTKFAVALLLVGLGFAVLVPVAGATRVSPMWLTLCYLLQTIGELLLSPVGLSAMTKLAPARIASLTMGVWFLADSVGNYIGGVWASVYEILPLPRLFGLIAAVTIVFSVIMAILVKPIKRLMGGIN